MLLLDLGAEFMGYATDITTSCVHRGARIGARLES